jgi:hypothetical protein
MRRKSKEQWSRAEASAGEIVVGFAWVVFYIALVGWGWTRDAMVLLAERGPTGLF